MTGFEKWMEMAGFTEPASSTNDGMGIRSKYVASDVDTRLWGKGRTNAADPHCDTPTPEKQFGFTDANPLQTTPDGMPIAKRMGKKMSKA